MSSAKSLIDELIRCTISLMYRVSEREIRGHSIEPLGTPAYIEVQREEPSGQTALCFRSFKLSVNHIRRATV